MLYPLENHKLLQHLPLVLDWLKDKPIKPITVEISPSSNCNHRCLMCGYDYLGHTRGVMPGDSLVRISHELAEYGVKGIVFAGDGEPFLNPALLDAIIVAKKSGADVAISSNGILLFQKHLSTIVENLTWFRFSVNGVGDSYAKVHNCKKDQYKIALNKIQALVGEKRKQDSSLTIGVQMVLLPENIDDALILAKTVKDIGVDYFVMKPFYFNKNNQYGHNFSLDYNNYLDYFDEIERLSTNDFYCKMRLETLENKDRNYHKCLGWPFILYVRSDGELMPCLAHQGNESLSLGSLLKKSFFDLWTGDRKKQIIEIMEGINVQNCQPNCRHHNINQFLWEISQNIPHKNFI